MRKVLVTGGAGFVGRHLVRRLLERGDEVHAVDRTSATWPLFDPRDFRTFRFYNEDCRDWFARERDSDFDQAFHLAAVVGGRASIQNDPLACAENLSIDAAYWRWARDRRPGKTACFSSSAVYPVRLQAEGAHVPLKEDMVDFGSDLGIPDLVYGWSKLTCEYLARIAYLHHGLKSACLRPFSGYGEDQDRAYPIPSLCRQILAGRSSGAVDVWGTGAQSRDFIHVEDCVSGVLLAMDRIEDGSAVNLSTGVGTSFAGLVKTGAKLAGYEPRIRALPDKPAGVFARVGDTAKQRLLGFAARVPLPEGLKRVLEYLSCRA